MRVVQPDLFGTQLVPFRTVWKHNDVLRIAPAGKPWSVWLLWDCETHEFRCWYANIEAPHRRQQNTVLTRDYTLDLVIAPEGRRQRKGQDQLEIALRAGWYSREEVEWILCVATKLEAVIDSWEPPFCDRLGTLHARPRLADPPLPIDRVAAPV